MEWPRCMVWCDALVNNCFYNRLHSTLNGKMVRLLFWCHDAVLNVSHQLDLSISFALACIDLTSLDL
jgi:hypothetical protein